MALGEIREAFPGWPYSKWSTARLIRDGWLGCVRVGRRVFVTRTVIETFIAKYTVHASLDSDGPWTFKPDSDELPLSATATDVDSLRGDS